MQHSLRRIGPPWRAVYTLYTQSNPGSGMASLPNLNRSTPSHVLSVAQASGSPTNTKPGGLQLSEFCEAFGFGVLDAQDARNRCITTPSRLRVPPTPATKVRSTSFQSFKGGPGTERNFLWCPYTAQLRLEMTAGGI